MRDQQEPYGIIALSRRNVSAISGLGLLYIATFGALWPYGDGVQALLAMSLAPVLIWVSVHDLNRFELPDTGTLAIACIGAGHIVFTNAPALVPHIGTAIAVTAFFWLFGGVYFRRSGHEGLGIGDAKLFGAGALLLGPWPLPELILLPSLGGICFHILVRLHGARTMTGIPFGPFIAYAIFVLSFLDPIFL